MKKGFTLIELLAVIVVLAIIALVATPLIINVVEESNKRSAEISATGYLDSLEESMVAQDLLIGVNIEKSRIYKVDEDTNYVYSELEYFEEHPNFNVTPSDIYLNDIVNIKGTKPIDGYVIIGESEIEEAEFVLNGYTVYCDMSRKCSVTGKYTNNSNVTNIKINDLESYVLAIGSTKTLTAKVDTVDGTDSKITWTSLNPEVATIDKDGNVTGKTEGQVTIVAKAGGKKSRITLTVINDSILGYLSDASLKNDTIINIPVNGENYSAHIYVYDGDTTFTENMVFGDANDIATSNTYAKNMVIVKVNGDLTINSGVTVKPYSTQYGGPKGFTIYVTGKLTNNGTIDNSHGAKAEGQDVYLWKNADGTYEYVPAKGGAGGTSTTTSTSNGTGGTTGTGRMTGGGGTSGGLTKGKGTNGTSYSGGTGGAASTTNYVYDGQPNGGAGGNANTGSDYGGGAGNPGGAAKVKGTNGTGGLLIIYANGYVNKGSITATGSLGGNSFYSGGSSGGGSINIFTNEPTGIDSSEVVTNTRYSEIKGTTNILGGKATSCTDKSSTINPCRKGGAGGNGTVNIGEIRNGQYYNLKEIIEQDKEAYQESVSKQGDSILSILNDNSLKTGYYNFKVNGENYNTHIYVYDGSTTFTENMVFGDANDIATSNTYAKNMVIVKVNGDLTINSGVTVKPYSTQYGGPKGFTIYVTGKLTNNGTIDNSHGAKAEGQDVYLWKNADGTYEYVPAKGGAGGTSTTTSTSNGTGGTTGTGRMTGGGGTSGGLTKGKGTNGTSYSGGTGGAASTTNYVYDGQPNGGAGGNANTGSDYGGGAGNPGGAAKVKGTNGTGGLLIIYANGYVNKGSITATGSLGGNSFYSGGSSGGGSINIFTNEPTGIDSSEVVTNTRYSEIKGTTNILGGKATSCTDKSSTINPCRKGGAGGNGTVNIGEIRNGQYYNLKEIIEQDKEAFSKSQ